MQKTRIAVCALVLFAMAMIGCVAAADTPDHVITVSGSGSVTGTPDRVHDQFLGPDGEFRRQACAGEQLSCHE